MHNINNIRYTTAFKSTHLGIYSSNIDSKDDGQLIKSIMASIPMHPVQQNPQQSTDKVTLTDALSNVDVLDDVVLCDDVP